MDRLWCYLFRERIEEESSVRYSWMSGFFFVSSWFLLQSLVFYEEASININPIN